MTTALHELRTRARRSWDAARALWASRNADRITAQMRVTQTAIERSYAPVAKAAANDLRRKLQGAATPLSWRLDDARWALGNAWRAACGLPVLPVPHQDHIDVQIQQDMSAGAFTRNERAVIIRGERYRRPVDLRR